MKKFIVKTADGQVISDCVRARSVDDAIAVVRKMYPTRLADIKLIAVERETQS